MMTMNIIFHAFPSLVHSDDHATLVTRTNALNPVITLRSGRSTAVCMHLCDVGMLGCVILFADVQRG